ncbi:unnamed protein product, partial [Effrenium voratum]
AGQVGGDLTDAAASGASAAAPVVQDAAQAGAQAAWSGAQAAAPVVKDAASSAANAVMSGAQAAAPMVGDAASSIASNLGDAAGSLGDQASDGSCFPGDALVHERQRGQLRMAELRIGDELHCGGNTFSPVIAMLHCSPGVSSRFLSIAHEGGFLAISLDHLLWAKRGSDWKWVAAKHLQMPNDIVSCRGQHSAVLGVKLEEAAG